MSVPQPRLCLASSNPGPDFQLPTSTPTPPSNLLKGLLLPPFQSDMARVSSKSSPTGLVARYTIFRKQKKILNSSSVLQWHWITIMANSSKKIDKIWGCFKCWVDVPFVPRCSRLSNNNRQAQPTPRNFQPPLMVPENPSLKQHLHLATLHPKTLWGIKSIL